MAGEASTEIQHRIMCNNPHCRRQRQGRKQHLGRFLLSFRWEPNGLRLSLVCPECGQEHCLLLVYPHAHKPM